VKTVKDVFDEATRHADAYSPSFRTGIKCRTCGVTVYSRAGHDFRWCPCKSLAVDGGPHYLRVSGYGDPVQLEIDATETELYHDWNYAVDRYGWVLP
jgi:hypothetical protein